MRQTDSEWAPFINWIRSSKEVNEYINPQWKIQFIRSNAIPLSTCMASLCIVYVYRQIIPLNCINQAYD